MQLKEILEPDSHQLRVFAGLQIIFVAVVCFLVLLPDSPVVATVLMTISVVVGVCGVTNPRSVRWIYVVWMLAFFPVGWTVSHLVMAIVYFGVITPIGIWRRRRAGDPLQREIDPEATSYWEEISSERSPESYFRQF